MSDERTYLVVVNDEEQYSIWPQDDEVPAGWHGTGFGGPREQCLAHVEQVWTDMRPRSLRLAMRSARDAPTDDPGGATANAAGER